MRGRLLASPVPQQYLTNHYEYQSFFVALASPNCRKSSGQAIPTFCRNCTLRAPFGCRKPMVPRLSACKSSCFSSLRQFTYQTLCLFDLPIFRAVNADFFVTCCPAGQRHLSESCGLTHKTASRRCAPGKQMRRHMSRSHHLMAPSVVKLPRSEAVS